MASTDLPLPKFWKESIDEKSGRTVYIHTKSHKRTFQRPVAKAITATTTDSNASGTILIKHAPAVTPAVVKKVPVKQIKKHKPLGANNNNNNNSSSNNNNSSRNDSSTMMSPTESDEDYDDEEEEQENDNDGDDEQDPQPRPKKHLPKGLPPQPDTPRKKHKPTTITPNKGPSVPLQDKETVIPATPPTNKPKIVKKKRLSNASQPSPLKHNSIGNQVSPNLKKTIQPPSMDPSPEPEPEPEIDPESEPEPEHEQPTQFENGTSSDEHSFAESDSEESMELGELLPVPESEPQQHDQSSATTGTNKKKTAREKKRELEIKYASTTSQDTSASSAWSISSGKGSKKKGGKKTVRRKSGHSLGSSIASGSIQSSKNNRSADSLNASEDSFAGSDYVPSQSKHTPTPPLPPSNHQRRPSQQQQQQQQQPQLKRNSSNGNFQKYNASFQSYSNNEPKRGRKPDRWAKTAHPPSPTKKQNSSPPRRGRSNSIDPSRNVFARSNSAGPDRFATPSNNRGGGRSVASNSPTRQSNPRPRARSLDPSIKRAELRRAQSAQGPSGFGRTKSMKRTNSSQFNNYDDHSVNARGNNNRQLPRSRSSHEMGRAPDGPSEPGRPLMRGRRSSAASVTGPQDRFRDGGLQRGRSASKGMGKRSRSMDALTAREASTRDRIAMVRAVSRQSMNRSGSIIFHDQNGGSQEIRFYKDDPDDYAGYSQRKKKKTDYERPPKSLVLIWSVVAGELGFDLGTTVIAFKSMVEEDNCCGKPITLGPVPMTVTFPFFLLVAAELAILIRAIVLTLFPNLINDDEDDEETGIRNKKDRSVFMTWFCCCLRWKFRMLMRILGFLVLMNPFFGCVIAWILLYQSDKADALTVLGFEGGSLALHYLSVYLEGAITNCTEFFLHGLLPLVPFTTAVGLVLFYLKQGGVCYIADEALFKFNGCEVCSNGYPPVDGLCFLKDGSNYTFVAANVFSLDNINTLDGLTSRTYQTSYCAHENPEGPQDVSDVCFFDFEEGLIDGIALARTEGPTATPVFSTNRCGGTVDLGDKLTQCQRYLWDSTGDNTMHCFAFGGPNDPCHLNIANDGENEGRFKDPSGCVMERLSDDTGTFLAYGDTFFLWDEPDYYGKDYAWAGNAWLAYSTSRFATEMATIRNRGVRVTTPLVKAGSTGELFNRLTEFFNTCGDYCNDPTSTAYVDILAVKIFCDLDVELCSQTASSMRDELIFLSASFGNRPVYVASWGILDTEAPSKLITAMDSTHLLFDNGSPVERVYWFGGSRTGVTNLDFQSAEGSKLSLGDIWSAKCDELNFR